MEAYVCVCVTLYSLELVGLYDDTELEHKLRGALQERSQQMEHADVGILINHPPVKPPAVIVSALPAPNAQVDGVEVPGEDTNKALFKHLCLSELLLNSL